MAELASRGFAVVPESARAIIVERVAAGQAPRPDPITFAQAILRRDAQNYVDHASGSTWTFYDRCAVEAIGMLDAASPLPRDELASLLATYTFHRTAFVLPPWEAIYVTDSERDHSFAHAVAVHGLLVAWYRSCGYRLVEVPRDGVKQRADHVLDALGASSDTE